MSEPIVATPIAAHGAAQLPSVTVDSYNARIKDEEGFVGDQASKGAFRDILEEWRKRAKKNGRDPFGGMSLETLPRKKLDEILKSGDTEAASLVQTAIEDFAKELAGVIRRFLKLKAWADVERIVVGGGMSRSRIGELTVRRAEMLLREHEAAVPLTLVRNKPDEAGLVGGVHLAPSWIFEGYEAILAIDIGGTNMRAGVVCFNRERAKNLAKAAVWKLEVWRHADEEKLKRDDAVAVLAAMLAKLVKVSAKNRIKVAPFIGIGCPGKIDANGSIEQGAQNLPGNWESDRFHLPSALRKEVGKIGKHETHIVMHNDAVVQGLSEVPFMTDVKRWGVLTIGTGLGNACFTNRKK